MQEEWPSKISGVKHIGSFRIKKFKYVTLTSSDQVTSLILPTRFILMILTMERVMNGQVGGGRKLTLSIVQLRSQVFISAFF